MQEDSDHGGKWRWNRSHHHKPRGSSFGMPTAGSEHRRLLRGAESVLFAVGAAVHFVIVVAEDFAAILQATLASHPFSISNDISLWSN